MPTQKAGSPSIAVRATEVDAVSVSSDSILYESEENAGREIQVSAAARASPDAGRSVSLPAGHQRATTG